MLTWLRLFQTRHYVKFSHHLEILHFDKQNILEAQKKSLIMTSKHLANGSSCPEPLPKNKVRFYTMRFCPFAHRISLVAAVKDIVLDSVYINLADKPSWYLEKTPQGKVPTLEVNDQLIVESLICAQFLDDLYDNNKLTSTDPYKKARHSLLLEEFGKFSGSIKNLKSNYSEETVDQCIELLQPFEKELSKEKTIFFGGNQVGMLDLMIWPWFERIPAIQQLGIKFEIQENKLPSLYKWQQQMREVSGIQKVSLDIKNYINYIKTQASGNPIYDP